MKRSKNANKMLKWVSKWQESGLSQPEFARQNKLKIHQFRYWIKVSRSFKKQKAGFVELKPLPTSPPINNIYLRYPNGVELHFENAQVSPSLVKDFVKI